ncbi:DNA-directed DNA polymerase, partial [Acinetobacter baumannii]
QPPQLITTRSELAALLPHLLRQAVLGFDLETTGLDPHQDRVRLVSLAWDGGVALVDASAVPLEELTPLFGPEGPVLVGHNLKFDLSFLL